MNNSWDRSLFPCSHMPYCVALNVEVRFAAPTLSQGSSLVPNASARPGTGPTAGGPSSPEVEGAEGGGDDANPQASSPAAVSVSAATPLLLPALTATEVAAAMASAVGSPLSPATSVGAASVAAPLYSTVITTSVAVTTVTKAPVSAAAAASVPVMVAPLPTEATVVVKRGRGTESAGVMPVVKCRLPKAVEAARARTTMAGVLARLTGSNPCW